MPACVKADPVLSYFWNRLYYYDQNVLLIVCGGTGSCKSGSSLQLGYLMDRDKYGKSRFNLDHVIFKAEDFVKLVSGNLPKGSVIIWDEIGVEHDARNYYSLKNKLVKYVMQTFRYRNFMLIMTVPDLKSIDIGTRRLLHCYLEMNGPIRSKKAAIGHMKFVQVNPMTGKEYFKLPRFYNKVLKKLSVYYIPRPPKELEDDYKVKKKLVTQAWYKDFNQQLSFMKSVIGEKEEKVVAKGMGLNELAEIVLGEPSGCVDRRKNQFSPVLIKSFFETRGEKVNIASCTATAKLLNLRLDSGEIRIA